MPDLIDQIARNVAQVRQRMAEAARRSGRSEGEVTLVAVTKYVGQAEIRALAEAGCRLLGESRPQQLWPKAEAVQDLCVVWHMIGHLQRNKVRRTLPLVEMVQSADTPRLVEAIDRVAEELSIRVPILLEVNVSGEAAKHGFVSEEVEPYLPTVAGLNNVQLRGLMCMAALEGGLDAARRDFVRLRELRDRLRPSCPENVQLDELSMGMSRDFEVAIQEGATIVRVGSALFEGVP